MENIERREQERNKQALMQRREESEDFKWLMKTKQGRRVARWVLDKAGLYRTTFRLNSEMQFLEGQRNLGLMFVAAIAEHSPDGYLTMLKEQIEDDRFSNTRSDRKST